MGRAGQSKKAVVHKIRLQVGDDVMVRTGAQKGKTGRIVAVHPELNKVTVEGIQVVKKHIKPNREHPKGAIIDKTMPIWVSKVGIVHPTDATRTSRIGYKVSKDGTKSRVYRAAENKEIK